VEVAALHRVWFEEILTAGRLERVEEIFAPDHVLHVIGSPELPGEGRPVLRLARALRRAAPDLRFVVDRQIVSADHVVTQFQGSGSHHGNFGPLPPTHRFVAVDGVEIARVKAGKIAESWLHADLFGMAIQAGVIRVQPPPPADKPPERQ
jgi:hypothetical protein